MFESHIVNEKGAREITEFKDTMVLAVGAAASRVWWEKNKRKVVKV